MMIQLGLKFIAVIAIALPIWLVVRRPWKRFEDKSCNNFCVTKVREICLALFVLFMSGLLVLTLDGSYLAPSDMLQRAQSRIVSGKNINVVPFCTIKRFFTRFTMETFLINIVGNVVMFLPWGFGVVLLWKRNQTIWRVVGWSFLLTASIETCQLFIGRSVDIDDLILNFFGSCIGAVLYFIVQKKFPQIKKLAQ